MAAALGSFSSYGDNGANQRSWLAALLASSVIYVGAAVAVALLGTAAHQVMRERPVDITFTEYLGSARRWMRAAP